MECRQAIMKSKVQLIDGEDIGEGQRKNGVIGIEWKERINKIK